MDDEEKVLEIKDIKTLNDIQTVIEQRAGMGLRDSIAVGKKFAWFEGANFELFEPVPVSTDPLTIFAMFQDADDVRVYAVAVPKKDTPPKEGVALYQRFTLSKHAAKLCFAEVFPGTKDDPLSGLEAFIDACVRDLQRHGDPDEGLEAIDTLERAREALEEEDLDAVMKILKGEEEDEVPPKNGAPVVAPPPAA